MEFDNLENKEMKDQMAESTSENDISGEHKEVVGEELTAESMTDEGEGVKDVIVGEEAAANKRWYVVQTYSGQEDKVKQAIEKNIDRLGLRERVFQILIPEEDIVELRGKKRIEKKKKMFPGYIFLEMILTDETWHEIRQTPGVARFIGTKIKPTPVIDREMQRVLKQIGVKAERLEVAFEKGEVIRIVSGPFRGYTGSIDEINVDREKLKVLINIFGRDTPVEVNFEHAEKVV